MTKGQLGGLVGRRRSPRSRRREVERDRRAIEGTTTYDGFGDVDFVIEAVPEQMELKQAVFAELDAVTPGHAILASNTSSLSISEIGEATIRPIRSSASTTSIPASVMRLIEVIEGDRPPRDRAGRAQLRPGRYGSCRYAAPRSPASS